MNWFTKPQPSTNRREEEYREKKTEETVGVVNDFLSEMRQTIKELQATSDPERKDYPIASALRRSTK